jgi:hypothetical protein
MRSRIDPEKLLELQAGESLGPSADQLDNLDFPINPERRRAGSAAADFADPHPRPHLRPRRQPAARFQALYSRGQILRYDLPPTEEEEPSFRRARAEIRLRHFLQRSPAGLQGAARRQWRRLPRSDEGADGQPVDIRARQ